jgi:4-amino-4-deoxy-L-arabinose transferase-like glycosyltransferase
MSVADPAASAPPPKHQAVWTTLGVALLLAIYAALAVGATLHKGMSFDEAEELSVGYNLWLHHDFRMESANGDLVKRWATLPYLFTRPNPAPTDNDYWRKAKAYRFGEEFFFESGNAPEWLLLQGRAMAMLIGVATGWLIFICARELFGALGGFFSLALFVFSPHMPAFGGIVSTDMSACLTLLGSTWCVWRLLHKVTWGRLAASLVFSGLLVLAKPSGLVIFPITALLIIVKLAGGRPLEWRLGRPRILVSRRSQSGVFCGMIVLHALAGWTLLWAHYDFRFNASPDPGNPEIIFRQAPVEDPVDPTVASFMVWAGKTHLLPEGFLAGMHALLTSNEKREAFMNGQWKIGGWTLFFPYTMWVKTSPALFLLLGLGLAGWWRARRPGLLPAGTGPPGKTAPSFYEGTPYFALAAFYLGAALLQEVDIGHRHILPVYPPLYIRGGGAIALLWPLAKKTTRALTVLLLGWFVLESITLYPNYLAYFNPLTGGAAQGYQHLVDSSLDWGMNLPELKTWLDQNNPGRRDPVFLAYFGTDSPEYYGIQSNRLPCYPDWRPHEVFSYAPGLYVISATLFESDYTFTFGPWNTQYEQDYQTCLHDMEVYEPAMHDPLVHEQLLQLHPQEYWDNAFGWFEKFRFGRLCAWLRHHRAPDANIGYSLLIWRLSAADLQAALLGPAPEIDDRPL